MPILMVDADSDGDSDRSGDGDSERHGGPTGPFSPSGTSGESSVPAGYVTRRERVLASVYVSMCWWIGWN